MRIRLLPAVFAVAVLTARCGEHVNVSDAGVNAPLPTTTSATQVVSTAVTAVPIPLDPIAAFLLSGRFRIYLMVADRRLLEGLRPTDTHLLRMSAALTD